MADQTEPKEEETPEPTDNGEKDFWERMDARIDAGIDRALKRHRTPSQQRTGGRTTVPGLIADIFFGKEKL